MRRACSSEHQTARCHSILPTGHPQPSRSRNSYTCYNDPSPSATKGLSLHFPSQAKVHSLQTLRQQTTVLVPQSLTRNSKPPSLSNPPSYTSCLFLHDSHRTLVFCQQGKVVAEHNTKACSGNGRILHSFLTSVPQGAHYQIDHVLIDRRRQSSILDGELNGAD